MEEPSTLGSASYSYEGVDGLFKSHIVRLFDALCVLCSFVEAVIDADTPEAEHEAVLEAVPEADSEAVPEAVLEAVPEADSEAVPEAVIEFLVQIMHRSFPRRFVRSVRGCS